VPSSITVRAAADSFLDSIRSANTRRAYTTAVDKTTAAIGDPRLLADVADDEIGETLETLWGSSAVNSWNARRAAVASWLAWSLAPQSGSSQMRIWCFSGGVFGYLPATTGAFERQ